MTPIDFRGPIIALLVLGCLLGAGSCQACRYIDRHVVVSVRWVP